MRLQSSVSGRAERDLGNQYRWYLDNANLEVAERFLTAFDATVQRLVVLPGLGRLRKFRSPELVGIRSLIVGGGPGHPFFRQNPSQPCTLAGASAKVGVRPIGRGWTAP